MKDPSKVRSNFNMGSLLFSVITGEPEAVDSAPAVVGSLADGTDDCTESCGVQLYESVINVKEQGASAALGNFYYSWDSVLMDHSDFDFVSVIIFVKAVWYPQNER